MTILELKAQALNIRVQADDLREQAAALDAQYALVLRDIRVNEARLQQAQEDAEKAAEAMQQPEVLNPG